MNEQAFLTMVAKRLGRDHAAQVAPVRDAAMDASPHTPSPTESRELAAKFARELETLGGEVRQLENDTQIPATVREWLDALHPQRVGVWGGAFVEEFALAEVLKPYQTIVWGSANCIDAYQHVDVSITGCAYAIADTGTIVLLSAPERGRSVAVLPTVHLVILFHDQIKPNMGGVLKELSAIREALPSSVHFISGPSRSSDIENDQTIGIHGPAAVLALVVKNRFTHPYA
ncbi:LutC/YkgG family protein [Ferroacidibacillus organovorans]|uniref:LUD domain-containing protein n=1 Tax=Ferroacidibacillus organovorans TaxID=1765683 RepID=A0A162UHX5_9BACL|nr:LUD domain-containing protein [Ferroacidibacillus organovorans]KYP81773.1 hypothetical protein AYJ22_05935 [Ferroacidibacillus organovorans]OAG93295.1 hypothetical protein AYW79_11310 [Ferroacidibacillus organovorans]OPG16111.1 hypothetical protein B2M26_08700 [Ferroacidibacillus organovorans]